jgi:hypothetical protein
MARGRNAIGRMNKGDGNRIREKGWKEMKVSEEGSGERNRYEMNTRFVILTVVFLKNQIFCDVTLCW